MSYAPDYAEPFEAWRVGASSGTTAASGCGALSTTPSGCRGEPLVAECLRHVATRFDRLLGRTRHPAPGARCECGIYGTRLASLEPYLRQEPDAEAVARVFGVVALWGTVIECERGWRSSRAYPLRLFVPLSTGRSGEPPAEEIAARLSDYGVPVEAVPSVG